jgi:hypothetical protein
VLVAVPFACLAAVLAFAPGTAGGDLARRLLAGLASWGRRVGDVSRDASAPAAPPVDPGDDERDLATDSA